MNTHPIRLALVALSLAVLSGRALAAAPEAQSPSGEVRSAGAPRKLGLTVLGGLAVPLCRDQQGCDGELSGGPSLGALVLYAPNDKWAFGVAAQVARVHWRETVQGMLVGTGPFQIDSDLTSGFAAVAARYVPLPELRVTPILQAALGRGFQMQSGDNFHCNDGFLPTGQLAAGARARASAAFSFFALASATWGFNPSSCGVSDGAGATPFAGWGFGLHGGAAFDVLLL